MHEWVRSDEVQGSFTRAKKVKDQTIESAKKGFGSFLGRAKKMTDTATEAIKKKDSSITR